MSRYGSVTITSPTSLLTRIVESSDAADLASRANIAIASLPAGYVVVGLTLAGAGEGPVFTVTVEAGAAADVTGGFALPPTVTCFLASEAEAMLVARQGAGPTSGTFADTQVAGASKGTRFMGMVVRGAVATGGGSGAVLRMGFDNSTETVYYTGGPQSVLRAPFGAPVQVPLTGYTPGNVILVFFSVLTEDGEASGPTGFGLTLNPTVDIGAGPRVIHGPYIQAQNSFPPSFLPPLTWQAFVVPVPGEVAVDPIIGILLGQYGDDQLRIPDGGVTLMAAEIDAASVTQFPTTFLDPP